MNLRFFLPACMLCFGWAIAPADGVGDNQADTVRRQPPPGKPIAAEERQELERGVADLASEIDSLRGELKGRPALLDLLPDVQIFHKAVSWALQYDEFFNPTNEVVAARDFIRQGLERARQLREGRTPWTSATGLIVRGYQSRLDGSVQPYGLVVPPTYQSASGRQHRLDFWFHGRGEVLTELSFLRDRQRSAGEFVPRDAFVLHPYSRYCNGQKLAGEVDALEALEHVRRSYPIDENRLVVRGFSLGGAACWHMAVHHASRWAAAAPGAGFSETSDFLKVFQKETIQPTWYEKKLWHLYDCPDYAINLSQCPTVAYSGEKDSQKQAADMMAKVMELEGLDLVHVIGTNAGHHYTPEAKAEINRRVDSIVARGRELLPSRVRFATYTLRYPEMAWVRVEGLEEHWEQGRVEAVLTHSGVQVQTRNISALTLNMTPGLCPFDPIANPKVSLDGVELSTPRPRSDRSWVAQFVKTGGTWRTGTVDTKPGELRKLPGLQGPIDDAFLDSFLMVKPSGSAWHEKTATWVDSELKHAIEHWRRHFRGDARVKEAGAVTDADIATHNLILWGDPSSNPLINKILSSLPIQWDQQALRVAGGTHDASNHMPVLIYPNPLNPRRYIVLNSGFTFREYDYLNNARQVPKLPDYAVIDLKQPVTSRLPGGIAAAGFFNERWQVGKAAQ